MKAPSWHRSGIVDPRDDYPEVTNKAVFVCQQFASPFFSGYCTRQWGILSVCDSPRDAIFSQLKSAYWTWTGSSRMRCYKTSCECMSFWYSFLSLVTFLCLKSSWYYDSGTRQVCQAGTGKWPSFNNPRGAGCMGSSKISCTWSTYRRGYLSGIFLVHASMHWPPQFAFPHHSCCIGKMRARTQDTWSGHRRRRNLLTPQPIPFR